MRNILAILLIFNGICFGAVKKRYRTMARAKHSMQHAVKRKMCPFVQNSQEAKDKKINRIPIDGDFKCKIVRLNYSGSKRSMGQSVKSRTVQVSGKPLIADNIKAAQKTVVEKVQNAVITNPKPIGRSMMKNINRSSTSPVGITTRSSVAARLSIEQSAINSVVASGSSLDELAVNLKSCAVISDLSDASNSYLITTDVTPGLDNEYNAIYNSPDGGLICVGYCNGTDSSKISVVKYTNTGALDPNFGTGGIVISDLSLIYGTVLASVAKSVIVDSNSNVYVAGYVNLVGSKQAVVIAKYDRNGNLVTEFGTNGAQIYRLASDACSATGITIELLSQAEEYGSFFNLVLSGSIVYDGITQGLLGKIDPKYGAPIHSFQKKGFIALLVNEAELDPITVFNAVAVGAVQVPPSIEFTNYIYAAGYASYLGTNYMLLGQFDTNGDFVNIFDENGLILLDISNTGQESIATSLAISRGGPAMGGYWTDESGNKKSSQALFTYLGVLYSYINSADSSTDTQTASVVGLGSGEVIGGNNLIIDRSRAGGLSALSVTTNNNTPTSSYGNYYSRSCPLIFINWYGKCPQ